MYLTKTIPIKIYDTKVQFIVTSNICKTVQNIYKKHNIDLKWDSTPAGTMIALHINHYRIVINSDYLSYNTIIHEALHCIMCITFDRAIHEEEARCWLLGDICQQIFDHLKNKGITL